MDSREEFDPVVGIGWGKYVALDTALNRACLKGKDVEWITSLEPDEAEPDVTVVGGEVGAFTCYWCKRPYTGPISADHTLVCGCLGSLHELEMLRRNCPDHAAQLSNLVMGTRPAPEINADDTVG